MSLDEILAYKIEADLNFSDAALTTEDVQDIIKIIVSNPEHFAQLSSIYLPRTMDSTSANFQGLYNFAEGNNLEAIYINSFNLSNTTLSDLIEIIRLTELSQVISIHGVLDAPIKPEQFSILLQNDLIIKGASINAEMQLTREELFDRLKEIATELITQYVSVINASTYFDKDEDSSDSTEKPYINKLEFIVAKDHYEFDKTLLDKQINNVIDAHLRISKRNRLG